MGDSNVNIQVPQVENAEVAAAPDVKVCDNYSSCSSGKEASSVSMPICFLVKEQAKSLVAIQEVQTRLAKVENVQDDVVDAIFEIRNYLSDSRNFSCSNLVRTPGSQDATRSPGANLSKLTSINLSEHNLSIKAAHSPSVALHKSCINSCEFATSPLTVAESEKHFDLTKSKDSALESDKQDSGLDSDCRELHDIQPSLSHKARNSNHNESNDELLQLLDEISHRSTILQQQLATVEENSALDGQTDEMPNVPITCRSPNVAENNACSDTKFSPKAFNDKLTNHERLLRLPKSVPEGRKSDLLDRVPSATKQNISAFYESTSGSRLRRRGSNGIDSTTVSSILKETSLVDLQRYALIYLVDNAVLQTKLRESEQTFASKRLEGEKVENGLKEEARILMMENRELRISLDEYRNENDSLKSKVSMLERVLQSVNHENQELNWQLGESLNIHNLSKRGMHNLSQSYSFGNSGSASKSVRRSSLPSQLLCQNDAHISCVKSKLLSNASSFLDVTVEDPAESPPSRPPNVAYKFKNGPIHSSTPMVPLLRKQTENLGDRNPGSFSSVKKCLKSNLRAEKNLTFKLRTPDAPSDNTEGCVKTLNFQRNWCEETVPLDSDGKFPFNTILEKLKLNSEYRFSRGVSSNKNEEIVGSSGDSTNSAAKGDERFGNHSHSNETNKDSVLQRKKGHSKDIQQRIQSILDRIVAESEEQAS